MPPGESRDPRRDVAIEPRKERDEFIAELPDPAWVIAHQLTGFAIVASFVIQRLRIGASGASRLQRALFEFVRFISRALLVRRASST